MDSPSETFPIQIEITFQIPKIFMGNQQIGLFCYSSIMYHYLFPIPPHIFPHLNLYWSLHLIIFKEHLFNSNFIKYHQGSLLKILILIIRVYAKCPYSPFCKHKIQDYKHFYYFNYQLKFIINYFIIFSVSGFSLSYYIIISNGFSYNNIPLNTLQCSSSFF